MGGTVRHRRHVDLGTGTIHLARTGEFVTLCGRVPSGKRTTTKANCQTCRTVKKVTERKAREWWNAY